MIDKELEAIFKCHELLKDLDNETRFRVFKYLLDRYNFVPSVNPVISNNAQDTFPESDILIADERTPKSLPKSKKPAGKKVSQTGYSMLPNLNLMPSGKESLKDFFSKYQSKSNFDSNILMLYYLKNILKEESVGINHIYTCYKHLAIKVPNIKQSLIDTKNRKGWIDSANTDNLQVTIHGENYVEHEMQKN